LTPSEFRSDIIDPTLKLLDLYSPASSNLLLGTALVESKLVHRRQLGGGPARGYFQIEPATFRDVYGRYLKNKPRLLGIVNSLLTEAGVAPVEQLYLNDRLGCAIARIRYLYDPKPLPDADDIPALAECWVRVYNAGGKGTVDKFINAYKAAQ
jgi:hypothetical protein